MSEPSISGRYISLYWEHCHTQPLLNNQECEVLHRLVEEAPQLQRLASEVDRLNLALHGCHGVNKDLLGEVERLKGLFVDSNMGKIHAQGFRLGQEKMRERAGKECEQVAVGRFSAESCSAIRGGIWYVLDAILSLTILDKPEGK